jgi:microcystin-dependent protein
VGNVAIIGISSGGFTTLTTPPNSGASWLGPYQSQSAILRFTGNLTSGNAAVIIPVTGFFIVENNCTGNFVVELFSSSPGNRVCAPPGQAVHIYCDGVDVKYVNMPMAGSYIDIASTFVPAWVSVCDVQPYLLCDGTVYTASAVYGVGKPAPLLSILGSTFGGNGTTTFGVPDLRNRFRLPIGGGRVTTAGSGIDGATINSSGGSQNQTLTQAQLPAVSASFGGTPATLTPNQTVYGVGTFQSGSSGGQLYGAISMTISYTPAGSVTWPTYGANLGHGDAHPIMPPTLVSGITMIKT